LSCIAQYQGRDERFQLYFIDWVYETWSLEKNNTYKAERKKKRKPEDVPFPPAKQLQQDFFNRLLWQSLQSAGAVCL